MQPSKSQHGILVKPLNGSGFPACVSEPFSWPFAGWKACATHWVYGRESFFSDEGGSIRGALRMRAVGSCLAVADSLDGEGSARGGVGVHEQAAEAEVALGEFVADGHERDHGLEDEVFPDA